MHARLRSGRQQATRWLIAVAAVLATVLAWVPAPAGAQDGPAAYVVEITGEIDLGLAPYLDRILEQAEEDQGTVILHIDTPGGRLDAALEMRRILLETDVSTIALVDPNALSAGALIAMAAEQIHLTEGAVIGAATPVLGSGEPADEKTISAVRAVFRATAEARDRDPAVAEAMVDPEVEIPDLVASGELLTLSVPQAEEWGYADAVVEDLDGSLAEAGLSSARLTPTEPSPAESLVRWLTNPVVASLLMTVGIWLVIGDVLAGGFGIPALAGLGLVGLFFWGHQLAGLAGWEDVALIVLGLVLILLEVTVIPGTGIAGILGLAAFLGGGFMAMLSRDLVTNEQIQRAVGSMAGALVMITAGTVALFMYLARGGGPRGLVLRDAVGQTPAESPPRGWTRWVGKTEEAGPEAEPATASNSSLEGVTGVAVTDLRPGGIAQLEGMRVDVVTEGDHIPSGTPVEVIADHGYRRIVRAVPKGNRVGG